MKLLLWNTFAIAAYLPLVCCAAALPNGTGGSKTGAAVEAEGSSQPIKEKAVTISDDRALFQTTTGLTSRETQWKAPTKAPAKKGRLDSAPTFLPTTTSTLFEATNNAAQVVQPTMLPSSSSSFFGSSNPPANSFLSAQATPSPTSFSSAVGTSTILPTSLILGDANGQQLDQVSQGGNGGVQENFFNAGAEGKKGDQQGKDDPKGFLIKPKKPGKPEKPGKPGKPGKPSKRKPRKHHKKHKPWKKPKKPELSKGASRNASKGVPQYSYSKAEISNSKGGHPFRRDLFEKKDKKEEPKKPQRPGKPGKKPGKVSVSKADSRFASKGDSKGHKYYSKGDSKGDKYHSKGDSKYSYSKGHSKYSYSKGESKGYSKYSYSKGDSKGPYRRNLRRVVKPSLN